MLMRLKRKLQQPPFTFQDSLNTFLISIVYRQFIAILLDFPSICAHYKQTSYNIITYRTEHCTKITAIAIDNLLSSGEADDNQSPFSEVHSPTAISGVI